VSYDAGHQPRKKLRILGATLQHGRDAACRVSAEIPVGLVPYDAGRCSSGTVGATEGSVRRALSHAIKSLRSLWNGP
jgi:hypothetical protein